nr:tetratricopeptide repeat protein [Acidobacteriota bacterium]NIQ86514.1 tetratricopeptide repeat protein [Acidobacteriota bacterium]
MDRGSHRGPSKRLFRRASVTLVSLGMFAFAGTPQPLAAEPAPAQSRYETALTAYREGRYADAVAALSGPQLQAGEVNLLGWAHLQAGDGARAVAAFQRSLRLDPAMHDSHCGLGFAYLRARDFARAVASFDRAAAGSPGPECSAGRARALQALEEAAPSGRAEVAATGLPTEFLARGEYFWRRVGDGPFEPLYVRGVNLSFARPGKHITEFPRETRTYDEWFRLVSEMNANVVRVYTILPPEFYRALADFNSRREPRERLLLIQGIWAELPEGSRFRDRAYVREAHDEMRNAIDVVHGRATIERRYGHAHGTYRVDVSNHVLAFIFGREWEPSAVGAFHALDGADEFKGRYLSIASANPMESWLAEMLDHLIAYEHETYATQRPVAWMNWPTLDALEHPSEATFAESLAFRRQAGETDIGIPPANEIYDDDAFTLDETKLAPTAAFNAGVFASHHVYPYYPDFMRNEPRYGEHEGGRYRAYLDELKAHYRDIPLLVAEYGVPTSRAVGRYHPEGLDHGGHSEQEQAAALERMTAAIRESGCAGGLVFAWIDEWVKRNWMVAGTEDRDHHWYNAMDPEESYGLLSMLPAGRDKVRGDPSAWDASTLIAVQGRSRALHPIGDGADAARRLERLFVDSDAGYLYARIDTGGKIDWNDTAFALAIDTYGDAEGDHTLPLGLNVSSDVGFEFVVLLHGDRSRVLVDERYSRTRFAEIVQRQSGRSGWEFHDDYRLEANDDGRFSDPVIPHGRKFGRDGTVYAERTYDAGRLIHGDLDDDSSADWLYTPDKNMLEVRIPWGLLHFTDPSRHAVFGAPGVRLTTAGIRLKVYSYRPRSAQDSRAAARETLPNFVDAMPVDDGSLAAYRWRG